MKNQGQTTFFFQARRSEKRGLSLIFGAGSVKG
jgi:hypothetical protein